jgi:hypothetical protein
LEDKIFGIIGLVAIVAIVSLAGILVSFSSQQPAGAYIAPASTPNADGNGDGGSSFKVCEFVSASDIHSNMTSGAAICQANNFNTCLVGEMQHYISYHNSTNRTCTGNIQVDYNLRVLRSCDSQFFNWYYNRFEYCDIRFETAEPLNGDVLV